MSITLRGGTYHFSKMINGVHIRKSLQTGDKKLATQIARKIEAQAVQDIVLAGVKPIQLHKAIDIFVASRSHLPSHANCELRLSKFRVIADQALHEVENEAQDVIESMLADGYAMSTVASTQQYWNAFIAYTAKKGFNVCAKLANLKAPKGKVRWLTVEEESKLLAAFEPKGNPAWDARWADDLDLVVFLLDTGCRINEAINCTWAQVDFAANTVLILRSKGGLDTSIDLTDRLKANLLRRKNEAINEFIYPERERVTGAKRRSETDWMTAAVRRAGLSKVNGTVTAHTLRHTFASRLAQAGVSLLDIKGLLGHASITSTMVYAHLVPQASAKRATAILVALAAPRTATQPLLRVA